MNEPSSAGNLKNTSSATKRPFNKPASPEHVAWLREKMRQKDLRESQAKHAAPQSVRSRCLKDLTTGGGLLKT